MDSNSVPKNTTDNEEKHLSNRLEDLAEYDIQESNEFTSNSKLINNELGQNIIKEKNENSGGDNEVLMQEDFLDIFFRYLNQQAERLQGTEGTELQKNISKLYGCDLFVFLENSLANGDLGNLEFNELLNKHMNKETFIKMASGALQLNLQGQKFPLHILNYYAYMKNYKILKFLFDQFRESIIILKKDCFGKNLLDIGVYLKDESLLVIIINELQNNPPPFEGIEGLNSRLIANLTEFKLTSLGTFLDSRLFMLRNSRNDVLFNGYPKDLRLILENELPLKKESLHSIGVYDYNIDKGERVNGEYNFYKSITQSEIYVVYVSDIHDIYESNCLGKKPIRLKKQNQKKVLPVEENTEESDEEEGWYAMKLYEGLFDNYPSDDNLYSSKTLMAISDRKWKSYGKKVFIKDILYVLILIIYYSFLTNIPDFANDNDHMNIKCLIYLFLGYVIVISEAIKEMNQLISGGIKGLKRHFKNVKNLVDSFYIIAWAVFVAINTVIVFNRCTLTSCQDVFDSFFIIRSIANLSLSFRIMWLGLVNTQLGFMIRLILFSIKKTFFFFAAFILLIIGVTFSVAGLRYEKDDWGRTVAFWFSCFYYTYKLALGDFGDFFNLQTEEDSSVKSQAIYIYFFLATAILTIILLNLLISILGESYTNIKENENNYIYSGTHAGLYDIEKNYLLIEDEAFHFEKRRKLNYIERFLFFLKFLVYLIFKRKIITRYPNQGKYMLFSHQFQKNKLEAIQSMIQTELRSKTSVDPKLKLKI